jgi:hypothetical protein
MTTAPNGGAAASPASTRFALELGPFSSVPEVERVERQLQEAGYTTARVRQPGTVSLYAVLIERVGTPKEAETLARSLKEQGFPETTVIGTDGPLAVRVGAPLPLRGAVGVAERLRGFGHTVRVASQPGEVVTFTIRHGAFPSREEAGEKGEALKRLGLPAQIVQVR